jgi:cell wall-associated NlpC family hydrolase
MRISARIALPAAAVVAGATVFATVPALAANSNEAAVRPASAPALASALKQEEAAVQRKADAEQLAAVRAAVVANWQQQAAAAEAAAAEAAAAEAQWLIEQAVVAQWQAEAQQAEAAAAQAAAAAVQPYSAPAASSAPAPAAPATGGWSGSGAVGAAMSMLGQPYVSGGQAPGGFDCSGLVKWAYGQAGVSLPGGSYNQIGYGSAVSFDSLAPGDLVFYGPGGAQHVAIYIGGGQVVQASNYDTGVHTASIYYIGEPSAFRRL